MASDKRRFAFDAVKKDDYPKDDAANDGRNNKVSDDVQVMSALSHRGGHLINTIGCQKHGGDEA